MKILVCGTALCNLDHLVKDYPRVTVLLSDTEDCYDKLRVCINEVQTPYVIWVPDDDFTTEDYLRESVALLDEVSEAIGTDGIGVFFNEHSGSLAYSHLNYNMDSIEFFLSSYSKSYSPLSSFKERILLQARRFSPAIIHGVMRTEVMKGLLSEPLLFRKDIPVTWGDNIAVFLLMIYGGVLPLRKLAYIRSKGTQIFDPQISHLPDLEKKFLVTDEELFSNFREVLKVHGLDAPEDYAAAILYFLHTSRAITLEGFKVDNYESDRAAQYFDHYISQNVKDSEAVNKILNLVKKYQLISN
jgi:hypothetical protein